MGMSSRARLVYGYALGGNEDGEGWLVEEANEYGEWEPDWMGDDDLISAAEQRLLASVGFTETDYKSPGYFDRQRDAEARLGVELVPHGYELSCYALATHKVTVEWGDTAVLDFAALESARVAGDWDSKLAAAVGALGMTPKQAKPAWLLLAVYG